MSAKLGLVFPRFHYASGDLPLGVAMLAARARQLPHLRVSVCDTTFKPGLGTVRRFLDRERPTFVGVSLSTFMLEDALQTCRLAHQRGAVVFVGGPHPTMQPASMMKHAFLDAVVVGEGEETMPELLAMFMGGRRRALPGAWVRDADGRVLSPSAPARTVDLDSLPLPAWDLMDMERYLRAWGQMDSFEPGLRGVNISAGRGCPFACSFCQPVLDTMFGKGCRRRSPRSVIAEIRELRRRYGIRGFWFTDDTFTSDARWVASFCQGLGSLGERFFWGCTTRANLLDAELLSEMYRVGLRRLGVGLESASARIREGLFNKGVSLGEVESTVGKAEAMGIRVLLFLMLGAPDESRAEVLETISVAASLPASEASFSLFVPIPGTHIHERMKREGYAMSDHAADFDYYSRQPFRGLLSPRQLRALQYYAYLRFYLHPRRAGVLARWTSSPVGLRSLGRKMLRLLPDLP